MTYEDPFDKEYLSRKNLERLRLEVEALQMAGEAQRIVNEGLPKPKTLQQLLEEMIVILERIEVKLNKII